MLARVHVPTLIWAAIIVVVVVLLYHFTLGRSTER
jgi:hypothetical protein